MIKTTIIKEVKLLVHTASGETTIDEIYEAIKSLSCDEYNEFNKEIIDVRNAEFKFTVKEFGEYLEWLKKNNEYKIKEKTAIFACDPKTTTFFMIRDKKLDKKTNNIFCTLEFSLKYLGLFHEIETIKKYIFQDIII